MSGVDFSKLYLVHRRKWQHSALRLLYPEPKPESPQGKDQAIRDARNEEIRRRYEAGERVVDLAQEFGMTIQGIYRILRAGKH
jgi:hypothetical protein